MISPEEILADPLYTRFTGRSTASGLNDVGPARGGGRGWEDTLSSNGLGRKMGEKWRG